MPFPVRLTLGDVSRLLAPRSFPPHRCAHAFGSSDPRSTSSHAWRAGAWWIGTCGLRDQRRCRCAGPCVALLRPRPTACAGSRPRRSLVRHHGVPAPLPRRGAAARYRGDRQDVRRAQLWPWRQRLVAVLGLGHDCRAEGDVEESRRGSPSSVAARWASPRRGWRREAGAQVTIYTRDLPPQTRSYRATGTFTPDSRIALHKRRRPRLRRRGRRWRASRSRAYRELSGPSRHACRMERPLFPLRPVA